MIRGELSAVELSVWRQFLLSTNGKDVELDAATICLDVLRDLPGRVRDPGLLLEGATKDLG